MRKPVEKKPIKIGDQIYGIPSESDIKTPMMGAVVGYNEVVKKYAIEWSAGADSRESYETEMFVRSAKFSMKAIYDAMGLNLPQEG